MFIEDEDWNDEPNAQILSESLLSKKPNNSANVKVTHVVVVLT